LRDEGAKPRSRNDFWRTARKNIGPPPPEVETRCHICSHPTSIDDTCGVCAALDHGKVPHWKLLLRYLPDHPRAQELRRFIADRRKSEAPL